MNALTSEVWAKFASLPLIFQATCSKTSFMYSCYPIKNHLTSPFLPPFLPFVCSVNFNGGLLWSKTCLKEIPETSKDGGVTSCTCSFS